MIKPESLIFSRILTFFFQFKPIFQVFFFFSFTPQGPQGQAFFSAQSPYKVNLNWFS
eukprot:c26398_g1_i1 orf=139-309(-)